MENSKNLRNNILIILLGIILYVPFLGGIHLFDWDEINFAESAREMIVSGNYLDVQINFQSFWEKPPLFIWMQVLSMKIFGINEFAARFPNAICGIFTLLTLFHTGRHLKNEKFGWIWLMTYAGSTLPFFYFKSGIIDPWFNLFIFIGISNFIYYLTFHKLRLRYLFLSALFLGLAVLTKGPVALLLFILSFFVYLIIKRFKINTSFRDVMFFTIVLTITSGFWFIIQILSGNFDIIRDFVLYQIRLFATKDAGHGGFLLYHFVVLFVGVFPASIFALYSLVKGTRTVVNNDFGLWMQILFFVVLILFTIVNTKIVHYSSMCYFPISFLATVTISKIIAGELHADRLMRFLLGFVAIVFGVFVTIIPFFDIFKSRIIALGWIKDPFAIANLEATSGFTGFEAIAGIVFLFTCIWFLTNMAKHPFASIKALFIGNLVMVYLTMILIVPGIEAYSQRAAIEFYKSVADEDAYITTLGFKSYAHLYYGKANPPKNKKIYEKDWLLTGNIDKKTYIVFKSSRRTRYLNEHPDFRLLYEKNGFVFVRRDPVK